MVELPIVAPAPVVTEHAAVFRHLFDNHCQCRRLQHDLTGLIVLPRQRMAHSARCILDSADNTNLSRVLSEASWREDAVHHRRLRCMLQQPASHRRHRRDSMVAIDDTLCEHVGRLFASGDRHDHHGDGPSPLAPHPVTSCPVRGPVRFPLGLRRYGRDAELPQWGAAVATPYPALPSPTPPKPRHRLQQQVDPTWLQDPEFRARHEQFRTNIVLAIDLVEEAIGCKVPCGGVFDAWSLAEDVVRGVARRRQAGISRLKKNRLLETASFHRRAANGWTLQLPGPTWPSSISCR